MSEFKKINGDHSSPNHRINQLVEHSRQALALVFAIQNEITNTHQQLSQGFHIFLEEKMRKLNIERDEALLQWSHILLELNTHKVELCFQLDSHKMMSAIPQAQDYHKDHVAEDNAEVILGDPRFRQKPSSSIVEVQHTAPQVQSTSTNPSSSSIQNAFIHKTEPLSDKNAKSSIELDDSDYDPGLADAEQISLTQFSISELKAQMAQPKTWQNHDASPADKSQWKDKALEVTKRLDKPRDYTEQELKAHLLDLEGEVECCQQWSIFDRDVQNYLLTIITSRLRKIQDMMESNPFDQDRIAKMFRRLTRFSSDFRPGFIHGLSRDKVPEFSSWEADEMNAWQALNKHLDISDPLPPLGEEQKRVLQHVIELIKTQESSNDFSSQLRDAVGACLNAGISPENPHLAHVIANHLSYLSGKRFKKVRLAVHTLN